MKTINFLLLMVTLLLHQALDIISTTPTAIPNDLTIYQENTLQNSGNLNFFLYLPVVGNELSGYFVSPSGSDSNPGTLARPWKTIGKAVSIVKPGDILYVRQGVYNEKVNFKTSGTATNPILILNYPGENPIIDGKFSIPGSGAGLLVLSGNYIHASGIEVRNSAYDGVQVLGSHDIVSNMFIHHSQKKGILLHEGNNSIVENNRIWWNSIANEYGKGDSWSSGISATGGGITYAVIRRNHVWENWGQGINTYLSDHITIEDNIVHDSFSNNISIHDATNILCQRNLIYTNPASVVFTYGPHIGINIDSERDVPSNNFTVVNNISVGNNWNLVIYKGTTPITNILITNNTFVNGINTGGVLIRGYHQNITFLNNLVQQDGSLPLIEVTLNPDVSFSNNLWSKSLPSDSKASSPTDIVGDPKLAHIGDPFSATWFMLTTSSPAIDKSLSLPQVTVDYFGQIRGINPDIGADELNP